MEGSHYNRLAWQFSGGITVLSDWFDDEGLSKKLFPA